MDPRFHQCSCRTLHKDCPDYQRFKIQYHDLPVRGYFHRDVIGGFQSEEHRRRVHVPGAYAVAHPMSIIWGGVDCQVHDGLL